MPETLEFSKYLGTQIYTGRNAEKDNLSKMFAESKCLFSGDGVGNVGHEKVPPLGNLLSSQGKCGVRQSWDRSRLIAAPMNLMTSCGEKLMAQQGDSPLPVDFVSSRPL